MTHKHDFIVSDEDHADWLKARELKYDERSNRIYNFLVALICGALMVFSAVLWVVLR